MSEDPRPDGPDKVVRLSDRKALDAAPYVDKELVEKLEEMLRDARSGRTFSFGIATQTVDEGCQTYCHVPRGFSCVTLIGAVSRLLYNLHKDLDSR